MIRIAFILSLLFCICAGSVSVYAAERQKGHSGLVQKATDEHCCLVADDADDDHAIIKRNVHSFIPAYTPFVFQRGFVACETGRVNKAGPRSMLLRICVLRL